MEKDCKEWLDCQESAKDLIKIETSDLLKSDEFILTNEKEEGHMAKIVEEYRKLLKCQDDQLIEEQSAHIDKIEVQGAMDEIRFEMARRADKTIKVNQIWKCDTSESKLIIEKLFIKDEVLTASVVYYKGISNGTRSKYRVKNLYLGWQCCGIYQPMTLITADGPNQKIIEYPYEAEKKPIRGKKVEGGLLDIGDNPRIMTGKIDWDKLQVSMGCSVPKVICDFCDDSGIHMSVSGEGPCNCKKGHELTIRAGDGPMSSCGAELNLQPGSGVEESSNGFMPNSEIEKFAPKMVKNPLPEYQVMGVDWAQDTYKKVKSDAATNVCHECKEVYEYAEPVMGFKCWSCRNGA